ncbi:MAG: hypothetical protein ABIO95_12535, partial [Bdellovibrionota bacterium]
MFDNQMTMLRTTKYFRRIATRGMLALAFVGQVFVVSCSRLGNEGINDGSLGTRIKIVSGNEQLAPPSQIFADALIVRVFDPITDKPIPNVKVFYKDVTPTDTGAKILSEFALTNEDGLASVRAKSPTLYATAFKVEASVEGTNISTKFDLGTESVGACTSFTARTSVNPEPSATEIPVVAGERFGL